MHIFWKVTALLVSHLGLIVLAALTAVQTDADGLQRAAYSDPWYRVGLQLSPWGKTPPAGLPPLEQDLRAVAREFPADTQPLVWLVVHLHGLDNGGELNREAAFKACRQLHWSRCDAAGLQLLREALQRGVR